MLPDGRIFRVAERGHIFLILDNRNDVLFSDRRVATGVEQRGQCGELLFENLASFAGRLAALDPEVVQEERMFLALRRDDLQFAGPVGVDFPGRESGFDLLDAQGKEFVPGQIRLFKLVFYVLRHAAGMVVTISRKITGGILRELPEADYALRSDAPSAGGRGPRHLALDFILTVPHGDAVGYPVAAPLALGLSRSAGFR